MSVVTTTGLSVSQIIAKREARQTELVNRYRSEALPHTLNGNLTALTGGKYDILVHRIDAIAWSTVCNVFVTDEHDVVCPGDWRDVTCLAYIMRANG